MRKGDSTSFLRMDAMNKDTIDHYFNLLEDTLKEHNLLDAPSQLYNVDESGIPLDPKAPKVVTVKGTKKHDTNLQVEKDRSLSLHAVMQRDKYYHH